MLASLITLGCLAATAVQAAEFTNPIRSSGPDPFIVYDNATSLYYLQVTTGSDLRIITASTLGGLTDGDDQRVFQNASMISAPTVWASELHKIDGTWYIYYAHGERPYALKGGSSPLDTFAGPPVQLSSVFGIDGSVLVVSNVNYFVWSCQSDLSGVGKVSSICISELKTPTSIDSSNIAVLSQPTESWEQSGGYINEGPQALYWDNKVYLTYSASDCDSAGYSLGLLHFTGSDALDPASWTKKTDGPVFSSGNGEYGPGHNGIFLSPDGTELWNVYHAVTNSSGSCGTDRQTFAEKIDTSNFATDGPDFGTPAAKGSTAEGPSGEDGTSSSAISSSSTTAAGSTTSAVAASITASLGASSTATSTTAASGTVSSAAATSGSSKGHHGSHSHSGGGQALVEAASTTSASASASSSTSNVTGTSETIVVAALATVSMSSAAADISSGSAVVASASAAVTGGGLSCQAKRAKEGW